VLPILQTINKTAVSIDETIVMVVGWRIRNTDCGVRVNTCLTSGFVLVVAYKRETRRVRLKLSDPKNDNNQFDVPFDRNDTAVVVTDPSSSYTQTKLSCC
jgi:hypothetical protein